MFSLFLTLVACLAVLFLAGTWLSYADKVANSQGAQKQHQLINKINDELPQTQCAQCGYPGCRPYAEAIVNDNAKINLCPPGGDQTIEALANMLGQRVIPLDEDCGIKKPAQVAIIDEKNCIGCTLCIQACPVDAIVGAATFMHTVIEQDCTGCELCLAPCPVDCIELVNIKPQLSSWSWPRPVA